MKTFKIGDFNFIVDVKSTKEFYSNQNFVLDDCNCEGCQLYVKNLSLLSEILFFRKIMEMGVDLSKNLNNESTGVWCVCDDFGELNSVSQSFIIKGSISQGINQNSIDLFHDDFMLRVEFYQESTHVKFFVQLNKINPE
ncbi:MAG: hypothetical protein ACWA41_08500 [Putridiphycobacter sp.]